MIPALPNKLPTNTSIGVIGAGNYGTSLATHLAGTYDRVTIWAHEPELVDAINARHENDLFLPGVELPENIRATRDMEEAIAGKEFILSVVPSAFVRGVWRKGARLLAPNTVLVSCTKGIEEGSNKLPHEILADELPDHPAGNRIFLSGPSFAREILEGQITGVTIAGIDASAARQVQNLMRSAVFLTFTHLDVVGVEIAGAVKNVLAIASGAGEGLGFGSNTRSLLITRGLYEMGKILKAKGGDPATLLTLAGVGDLQLTATDHKSRNYMLGYRLGKGETVDDIIGSMRQVAEGYKTSIGVHAFVKERGIKAPICESVFMMLHRGLRPGDAVRKLLSEDLGQELRAFNGSFSGTAI